MAGSIIHTVEMNGIFTMKHLENMGDAHEALDEYFKVLCELQELEFGRSAIEKACRKHHIQMPPILRFGGDEAL